MREDCHMPSDADGGQRSHDDKNNNPDGCKPSATGSIPERFDNTVTDLVTELWSGLNLPEQALHSLCLEGTGLGLPSSFKISHIAQASIALSALTAALIHSVRNETPVIPRVTVPLKHAGTEFKSNQLYVLNAETANSKVTSIGNIYQTSDGHVLIHDTFDHHQHAALAILGCDRNANVKDISLRTRDWESVDLENEALRSGAMIAALRSYRQWEVLPHAAAIANFPITIRKITDAGPKGFPSHLGPGADRCLRGLRVLDLSRVIAAPLAAKTLAVHGADVLWITSPNLQDLPILDRDLGRGKRTARLDLTLPTDQQTLRELAKNADVVIQSYRPGSMAERGFSAADLAKLRPGIVYGNLSAYGPDGPWSSRRGFDAVVQAGTGMLVSEAEHYGAGEVARRTPCQVLDHASGYFLAAGVTAALYRRAVEGGSYEVHVSLAGTMKFLRSLGQYPGKEGFGCENITRAEQVEEFMEVRETGFGTLKAVRHSAVIEGAVPGWDVMPEPLGSHQAVWL